MKLKHILILLALVLIGWFIYDALTIPGVDDLEGDFKEEALYRNENNTGPITRIYAVSLNDTLWQQMEQYGDMMPHTKYGTTTIYFFLNTKPIPTKIYPGQPNFEERFQEFAVGKYEKDAMGQISFVRHPYK